MATITTPDSVSSTTESTLTTFLPTTVDQRSTPILTDETTVYSEETTTGYRTTAVPWEPTTLPIVIPSVGESAGTWIALSGVLMVLLVLISAVALYLYLAGRAAQRVGALLCCRRSSSADSSTNGQPAQPHYDASNNFILHDALYSQQLQRHLKNRTGLKHHSVSSISNNSSKAIRQKYPRNSVNHHRPNGLGARAPVPPVPGRPPFEPMDEIDEIKYRNRLNKL
uniref:Uncharacterized protein n=1 Tax=Anopheles albimanus TaxID=7167 RepID=A0A182FP62_ANOAL